MVTVGETYRMNNWGECRVVKYEGAFCVLVEFISTGSLVWASTGNIVKGLVKDPQLPVVNGVGFIGIGAHKCRNASGKISREYMHWSSMLLRVYTPANEMDKRSYKNTSVCLEWHNFQNFADWSLEQPGFNKDSQLDKDLLVKNNKIYESSKCCFLPKEINSALTGKKYINSSGHAGVEIRNRGKYTAMVTKHGTRHHLGTFDTYEDACAMYKREKEVYVRSLANEFRSCISPKAYDALTKWEINDNSTI